MTVFLINPYYIYPILCNNFGQLSQSSRVASSLMKALPVDSIYISKRMLLPAFLGFSFLRRNHSGHCFCLSLPVKISLVPIHVFRSYENYNISPLPNSLVKSHFA